MWLFRYHPQGGDYGSDYTALCVIHKVEDKYWMKGYIGQVDKKRENLIKIKEYFNIDKVYFLRQRDLERQRKI